MEVHTLVNTSAIQELRKDFLKPKVRKMIYTLSAVLLVIAIIAFFIKSYLIMTVGFVGVLILLLEMYFISKKSVKMMIERLYETYNTYQVEGKLIFEDDHLKTFNFVTKGELTLAYHIMFRFVETENFYTLFTKENQMLIVDKQQFDTQTKNQFLLMVKEKMPQLFA